MFEPGGELAFAGVEFEFIAGHAIVEVAEEDAVGGLNKLAHSVYLPNGAHSGDDCGGGGSDEPSVLEEGSEAVADPGETFLPKTDSAGMAVEPAGVASAEAVVFDDDFGAEPVEEFLLDLPAQGMAADNAVALVMREREAFAGRALARPSAGTERRAVRYGASGRGREIADRFCVLHGDDLRRVLGIWQGLGAVGKAGGRL